MGKNGEEKVEKVAYYRLFSFADWKDIVLMAVATVCSIATGLIQPLNSLIFGRVINSLATTDRSEIVHEVSQVSMMFVYIGIAGSIGMFLNMTCWIITGERQSIRIRRLYLQSILRQDIAFFDTETSTGEVIGRMSGDTILIQQAMSEKVGYFIQLMSTFIGGFAIAFARGWRLTLVMLSCIPVLVISGGVTSMFISKMASRGQKAYADAGNVVEQTIGAIRTVASFTGEKKSIEKYNSKIRIAYVAMAQQGLASGIGMGIMTFVMTSTYSLAVWYGCKLIITEGYNGGIVINVIMAVMIGGLSLGQTSPHLNAFATGQAAAYRMFETIKRKPKIDTHDTSGIVVEDINGDIELRDVHFKYPSRPDVQIFSGFSLNVPSGTRTALVGQSGSGKSTTISLLQRFYDPDSGEVLIDGIDLRKYQLKFIREKMGLVSQEPTLFMTTIRENIAYGKEKATDAEIRTAIELANAAKFIDKLPQGVDTMVGEHGTQLSGGQKQRIAIARAILKNPKILLLDEATSALDAGSERIVQDALTNIMSNRTTVVVAHRLTTVRNADVIAVVQAGQVVEQGSHDELIQNPRGAYSQLVRLQQGENKAEEETDNFDKIESIEIPSVRNSISSSRASSARRSSFSLDLSLPVGIRPEIELENENKKKEEIKDEKPKKSVSIMRIASLNKPEIPVLLLGTLGAVVNGSFFPVLGLLFSTAIKIFYEPPTELAKDSKFWSAMFVTLGALTFVASPVQNYFFGVAGGKLIQRIRSLTFEKVVHQEISWFDNPKHSSGALGARLAMDASLVKGLVGDVLGQVVQNMTSIIVALLIAFTANWILALVILFILPFMSLQGFIEVKILRRFSKEAKLKYEEASQVANDAVGSIRTVASFCAEKKVMEMYERNCESPIKQAVRLGLVTGWGYGFSNFALYCAMALSFYIGALLIHHGHATFSEVFKVFYALTLSAMGVSQSINLAPDTNKARDAAASVFEIIDAKSTIDSSSNEGTTLEDFQGDIVLSRVSFKYPTRPDTQIFHDLCLTIPSGKTVALVGESGSGKSTVISLIERFYDPDSGQVFLDKVDIKSLKIKWLRQQMGLVSQEPILFNETLRTNIAYGKEGGASEDEIIEAAKASNAHNFISSLPEGYDTRVGERGMQLSGGQKQRIAIARAIVKDPKILLLDEATSALDAESESVVQEALDRVMVNRTSVVVAHRLSTIKGADVIAVVKNGGIAEKGTHENLMMINGGAYASLVALHMSSS